MLDYASNVDVSAKPHQQSLTKAPTPGLRDWRTQMSPEDIATFEALAGDLLADLGYELVTPQGRRPPSLGARLELAGYRTKVAAWRVASLLLRRSPLWRRRHPLLD